MLFDVVGVHAEVVRHATIGRDPACRAEQADFHVEAVLATTPVFRDFQQADHTWASAETQQSIDEGHIGRDRGHRWFVRRPFPGAVLRIVHSRQRDLLPLI
ncbi:hypothetical protein ACIOZL_30545 [Streptomyces sp. NPDC087769]|uniref:hypothetical protein n=1 Tax=unclassified Streptomyces TaxID=2593676 RepID=UPI003721F490